MNVLWETGFGSCLVIIIGCAAAAKAIIPTKKKPEVAASGQNIEN